MRGVLGRLRLVLVEVVLVDLFEVLAQVAVGARDSLLPKVPREEPVLLLVLLDEDPELPLQVLLRELLRLLELENAQVLSRFLPVVNGLELREAERRPLDESWASQAEGGQPAGAAQAGKSFEHAF